MQEGGWTSASSWRCLRHKTGGRNNLDEQESNAVLDDSGVDLDEPAPDGTISRWIRSESEYVWTGEFDLNTLWSHKVWTRIYFRTRKEKVADLKISGYVWTGPKDYESSEDDYQSKTYKPSCSRKSLLLSMFYRYFHKLRSHCKLVSPRWPL